MDKKKIVDWLADTELYYREKQNATNDDFHNSKMAAVIIALLKEQDELIKAMKRDLDLVRSCKVCGNWTECTPDAPPESEEYKMWRDCGGSCKLNWIWRGV